MEPYHRLTQEQRYQMYSLQKAGHANAEIARVIGVHRATVGRELKRNGGQDGYHPHQAQQQALRCRPRPRRRITARMWQQVERLLRQDWSPEQIAGRLKREHRGAISHEWIYQHILQDKRSQGDLYRHLRCQKIYHKRYGRPERRGSFPPGRSIEERPVVVEQRQRLGDWEADTMMGQGRHGALLTLTERKSRFTLLAHLRERTPSATEKQVCHLLRELPGKAHTLTSDRGREFLRHERMADKLHLHYYLAHPYAAWERGTNENTNGLLRQYFPKQRNMQTVKPPEVRRAQLRLNLRPRKCLAFRTPSEVFFHHTVALTT